MDGLSEHVNTLISGKIELGQENAQMNLVKTLEKGDRIFELRAHDETLNDKVEIWVSEHPKDQYETRKFFDADNTRQFETDFTLEEANALIEKTLTHFEKSTDVSLDGLSEHVNTLISGKIELGQEDTMEAPTPKPQNQIKKEEQQTEKSPEEKAFLNALHQREVVTKSLQAGTLACLPGADGYAETSPAVNVANGTRYHGANLLQLKEHQRVNGFPTAEYVTKEAMEKSGIPLKAGQHGIDIGFGVKNEAGQWENKTATLYNAAQSTEPEKLKEWGAAQIEEKMQEKLDYLKQRYGKSQQPKERENLPGPEVAPKSAEPEKYLGAYLAAVSMGGKFKPDPETAKEFGKNLEASLFEKQENGHTNPFKLSKICNDAAEHCKQTIKEMRQEQRRELGPKQERSQSNERSM